MMEDSLNGTPDATRGALGSGTDTAPEQDQRVADGNQSAAGGRRLHPVVDQAIGVVITLGGLRPEQGFQVLREVSQHTNTKLRQVSELIVEWVHGEHLPDEIRTSLDKALATARSI